MQCFQWLFFTAHASFRFYAVLPIGIFRVVIGSILYLIWSLFLFDSWGSQRILQVLCSAPNMEFSNRESRNLHNIFFKFSIGFCLQFSYLGPFLFLGHLISGFPSAPIRFYALLPIGIFFSMDSRNLHHICYVFYRVLLESSFFRSIFVRRA